MFWNKANLARRVVLICIFASLFDLWLSRRELHSRICFWMYSLWIFTKCNTCRSLKVSYRVECEATPTHFLHSITLRSSVLWCILNGSFYPLWFGNIMHWASKKHGIAELPLPHHDTSIIELKHTFANITNLTSKVAMYWNCSQAHNDK